jgi:hypothetical protein
MCLSGLALKKYDNLLLQLLISFKGISTDKNMTIKQHKQYQEVAIFCTETH